MLKRNYKQLYNREPDIAASLCCGVLAAWSGQLVAFPLETVSRRMQLAGPAAAVTVPPGAPAGAAVAAAAAAGQGSSMAQVLAGILKEGGPAALYRYVRAGGAAAVHVRSWSGPAPTPCIDACSSADGGRCVEIGFFSRKMSHVCCLLCMLVCQKLLSCTAHLHV